MIVSKKKTLLSLAVAGLLSSPLQAASVSGAMDLSVTMPEILVLYHFDSVQIDLTDANNQAVSEGAAANVTIATSAAPATGALSIDGTTPTLPAQETVTVTLTDAWAIRSISSADVEVSGSIENATLTHTTAATSTIGVSNLSLEAGGSTGAAVTLAPQWAVQKGNISFDLSLATASHAGTYTSGGTTDTFLLTLTGN
ncbi:MAG: hypothetical protein ACPGSC_02640 [Granulosicoccaceae bacterium]